MKTDAASGAWADAARLSLGTLTVLRVRPPTSVDRVVAGRAMLLAPLVGLALGLVAAVVLFVSRGVYNNDWLPAALSIAALALLTRGLHLDGLADTADGLGASVRGHDAALDVMRKGDVGPFGVVTLVLVLVLQVLALRSAVVNGLGTEAIVTGCVVGRLAATWACTRGIPAARPDGLGATVAGSVSRAAAAVVTLLTIGLVTLWGGWLDDDAGLRPALLGAAAVAVGLLIAGLLLRRCVRRFGGITGDVLGAVVEVAMLGSLLVLAS